jgi:hypothetical protein
VGANLPPPTPKSKYGPRCRGVSTCKHTGRRPLRALVHRAESSMVVDLQKGELSPNFCWCGAYFYPPFALGAARFRFETPGRVWALMFIHPSRWVLPGFLLRPPGGSGLLYLSTLRVGCCSVLFRDPQAGLSCVNFSSPFPSLLPWGPRKRDDGLLGDPPSVLVRPKFAKCGAPWL